VRYVCVGKKFGCDLVYCKVFYLNFVGVLIEYGCIKMIVMKVKVVKLIVE